MLITWDFFGHTADLFYNFNVALDLRSFFVLSRRNRIFPKCCRPVIGVGSMSAERMNRHR
jgi:hypothetical protein